MHIHITCFTNPSPYSPSDEMDGFFIYIRTFATITATLQRKHIIRWINGLWWQIICNGKWWSATAPWQMWQMDFSASATGTCWFSIVWDSVADVYVILYDNSLFFHPEELCDEGSRVHPLYHSLLYVHEILRFALDDKRKHKQQWLLWWMEWRVKTPYLHVLTNMQARQGRFFNAPWRTCKCVKARWSFRQGEFFQTELNPKS